MSVVDIAKKTGQKPSTVFYLVKTLTDMGIVYVARRLPGGWWLTGS